MSETTEQRLKKLLVDVKIEVVQELITWNEEMDKEITELKSELSKEKAITDYYASMDSWDNVELVNGAGHINRYDEQIELADMEKTNGKDITTDAPIWVGGRKARERQKERRKL